MKFRVTENPDSVQRLVPDMEPINEMHLEEPGLVVIDVAAVDDRTAFALSRRWPLGGPPLSPAAPRVPRPSDEP
ncbi:DUF6207 family protein [Streptomyces sp. NPDC052701]|uniref:DUF6207 family protein n=1 Tax=Streptomyces sp. NPDC052701 TaxID=3155533 RepID=UPI00341C19F5